MGSCCSRGVRVEQPRRIDLQLGVRTGAELGTRRVAGGLCVSETERQELSAASGVAINQRTQADLMSYTGSGEPFGDNADHNSEHGGTSVEPFNAFQLLKVNAAGRGGLKPAVVSL